MKGLYIYGIRERSPLPLETKGVEGKGVRTVANGNLEAVVSEVRLENFRAEALKDKLQDLTWAEPQVRAHAAVLDACMRDAPVIPWKFGTIFKTQKRLMEFLQERDKQLTTLLCSLRNKQEWGLKMYRDTEKLRRGLYRTNKNVQSLEQERASQSPGAAFFLHKKLEAALTTEVREKTNHVAEEVFLLLKQCAADAAQNRLLESAVTGRGDDMILNAAFLIKQNRCDSFLQTFKGLERRFSTSGFTFIVSGPWPPYNFVHLKQ